MTHKSMQPLRWRHNGCDSISNHQPHDCLLNRLFRRRSKKTPKLRVTGLCVGNSPGTGELPAQRASNAEKCSHLMTSSCLQHSFHVPWLDFTWSHKYCTYRIVDVYSLSPGDHYNDVIMGVMASQTTSLKIVYTTVYWRNIKALRHWPLWGEFTGEQGIPHTKGQ